MSAPIPQPDPITIRDFISAGDSIEFGADPLGFGVGIVTHNAPMEAAACLDLAGLDLLIPWLLTARAYLADKQARP